MSLEAISVIISGICAVGSFISFLLAQKEKCEAKKSEAQAQIYAENANQANLATNELYQELLKDSLKNEIIAFIALHAPVNTIRIAEDINLSKEETFNLLYEMVFVDQTISCSGRCTKERIDDILWCKHS